MGLKSLLRFSIVYFWTLPKGKLIQSITILREKYLSLQEEHHILEQKNKALELLVFKYEKLDNKRKVSKVNKKTNQPSSKQPEWESKGVGNDQQEKKGKGRGKKGRKGAGNQSKTKPVTETKKESVTYCFSCGKELITAPLASKNDRIIEDIPAFPIATTVVAVALDKKYCNCCKKVTTASTDLALSNSDFGINTTVAIVYYWVYSCLSLPRIAALLSDFFSLKISTSGLSKQLIRVATIMQPAYKEILSDVKLSKTLHADETGWRVKGKNWWLWVFGTKTEAYFTIDSSRGKDVVRRVLGEIFLGVLVVDGWRAYLSLSCEQQSCMAHLLRKIRNLYAAFPKLESVHQFYILFRKILRDGEKLQQQKGKIDKGKFDEKLAKLHQRLDTLLLWENPNDILKDIIKKVERQKPRILTFVKHPDVPNHNNFAEYLIRIGVLKRKISSGSKSKEGAEAYAVLLSIFTTCKLRDISFLAFITDSLKHYAKSKKPLTINQYMALKEVKMVA